MSDKQQDRNDSLEDLRIDSPVPRPGRRRSTQVPWILLILAGALLIWFFKPQIPVFQGQQADSSDQEQTDAEETTSEGPSASPGPAGSFSAGGYLEIIPPGPFAVTSLVDGRISELLIVPGDVVEKGQVIARLDASILRKRASVLGSRVELAKRELESQQAGFRDELKLQAEADLASAESRLDLARREYERNDHLFNEGIISAAELDRFSADLRQAESEVENKRAVLELRQAGQRKEDIAIYEARLSAARSELSGVLFEIEQMEVAAPVSGVVYEVNVSEGDWLFSDPDASGSGALARIFNPQSIQAWVDVNQRDSAGLFVGQQVELSTDSQPGRIVRGSVWRIMPQANLQKNTVRAKIAIDEVPEDFRPELSVKVAFLPEQGDPGEGAQTHEPETTGAPAGGEGTQ